MAGKAEFMSPLQSGIGNISLSSIATGNTKREPLPCSCYSGQSIAKLKITLPQLDLCIELCRSSFLPI